MKFTIPKNEVLPFEKLWPDRFRVGNTLTSFRAYNAKAHQRFRDGCDSNRIEEVYLVGVGCLGYASYYDLQRMDSGELTPAMIKQDTYQHWVHADMYRFIKEIYGADISIHGFWILMKIEEVNQRGMKKLARLLKENDIIG